MAARNTTTGLQWDEIRLQSLADHMMTRIFMEALKSASRRPRAWRSATQMEPGVFLKKDLKTRLPAREGIAMVESHFHDEGMEFGNVQAVHTSLVMAIV